MRTAELKSVVDCVIACCPIASAFGFSSAQSTAQSLSFSPLSQALFPQQGVISVLMHRPASQRSVVQKFKSSHPAGQVCCCSRASSTGAGSSIVAIGAVGSVAASVSVVMIMLVRAVFVFVPYDTSAMTSALPSGASEGMRMVIGIVRSSSTLNSSVVRAISFPALRMDKSMSPFVLPPLFLRVMEATASEPGVVCAVKSERVTVRSAGSSDVAWSAMRTPRMRTRRLMKAMTKIPVVTCLVPAARSAFSISLGAYPAVLRAVRTWLGV